MYIDNVIAELVSLFCS